MFVMFVGRTYDGSDFSFDKWNGCTVGKKSIGWENEDVEGWGRGRTFRSERVFH